jgi:hypothetical protein
MRGDVRYLIVAPLLMLGLGLPAGAEARATNTSWAAGVISRMSPLEISVRGTITLALPNGTGGLTKSTLDGTRILRCSVERAAAMRGYRIGGAVKITCVNGTLSHIVHA